MFCGSILSGPMAVAVTAGDEQHGNGREPREEEGIVIGATRHGKKTKSMLRAGFGKSRNDRRAAIGGSIGVQEIRMDLDLSIRGGQAAGRVQRSQYTVPARPVC